MAGGRTIGRLSIKVSPDLGGFSSELKKKLKADRSEAEVPVKPDMTAFDKEVKARLKALDDAFRVKIKPVVSQQDINAIRRRLETAFKSQSVQVSADLDRSSAARVKKQLESTAARVEVTPYLRRLNEIKERLEAIKANVDVDLNNTSVRASRADVERMLENVKAQIEAEVDKSSLERAKKKIDGMEGKATVNVDLDRGNAWRQLKTLAHDRIVKLIPVVDAKAAAASRAALDALARTSGAHALKEWGRSVKDFLKNLDQIAPKAGVAGSALLTLGAAFVSLAGHATAVVTGLAKMTPILLTLPGLAVGAAVGFGVLFRALKDAKDVLADLGPAWTDLGNQISSSFWERAADPIRELSNSVMPTLQRQLPALSAGFGDWAAAIAGVLSSAAGIAHVEELLGNMVTATNRALPGVRSLTAGLLSLSTVGSRYMPRMADSFNRAAASFEKWASGAEGAARIEKAIDGAVRAAQHMWTIFKSLGSVLASLGKAAAAAGYGLEDTATKMEALARAMSSVTAQSIMIGIFTAARGTMAAFGAQLSGTGMALDSFAQTLAKVGPLAGQASGQLARMGIEVLGDPNFGAGLYKFFDGVRQGTAALQQVSPQIALVVGKVLELGGAFAQIAGQNIAAIFEQWGPILADIMTHLEPLVLKLGQDLTEAITFMTPILQTLADTFIIPLVDWLAQTNVNLVPVVAGIVALVAAFQGLLGLVGVIQTLQSIGSALSFIGSILGIGGAAGAAGGAAGAAGGAAGGGGLIAGLTGASGGFTGLGAAVTAAAAPIAAIIAVIAAVVAAVISLWKSNEEFRNNVKALWEDVKNSIGRAVQGIINWWNNEMAPAFSELWSAIKNVWDAVGAPIFDRVKSYIANLASEWRLIWGGIKDIFQGVWQAISSIFKGAVQILTGVFNVFAGMLKGDANMIKSGLTSIFKGMWTAVSGIFKGGINVVKGILKGAIGILRGIGKSIMDGFVSAIKAGFNRVKSVFTRLTKMIPSWKGPENVDKHLLDGPAKWIMQGFADALDRSSRLPMEALRDFTADIASEVTVGDMEVSGADVMIVNHYPKEQSDSATRNQVAQAIRLASI